MRRVANSRRHLVDLLRRRPLLDATVTPSEDPEQRKRIDQVREMLDLPDPEGTARTASGSSSPDPSVYPRGSSRI